MQNPERARPASPIERAWSLPVAEVLTALDVRSERGLDPHAVAERRQRFGPNRLRRVAQRSAARILLDQLASLMVGLLAAATILAFVMVDWVEGSAIVTVIVVNTAIGFVTEWKAVQSMEALHRLGQVQARVRRDGALCEVPAASWCPATSWSSKAVT
jgi:Ca2+-transporting ATPase